MHERKLICPDLPNYPTMPVVKRLIGEIRTNECLTPAPSWKKQKRLSAPVEIFSNRCVLTIIFSGANKNALASVCLMALGYEFIEVLAICAETVACMGPIFQLRQVAVSFASRKIASRKIFRSRFASRNFFIANFLPYGRAVGPEMVLPLITLPPQFF